MPNQAAIDPRLALPFDLMPELVADRFRAIPELSRSPLYNGARIGQHEIHTRHSYEVYAQQMIKEGNLTEALEAYKRGLDSYLSRVRGLGAFKDILALTKKEVDSIVNIPAEYVDLGEKLLSITLRQDVHFDEVRYREFVDK